MPTKTKTKPEKANNREEGIKAIIALQKFAGIDEPREQAEKGWDALSPSQRQQTLATYWILLK